MFRHEKVFVTPGAGRKAPLPLPGGGDVPADGAVVERTLSVERLITSKDLVVDQKKTDAANAPAPPAAAATTANVKG